MTTRTHLLPLALASVLALSCTHNSDVIVYVQCDTNVLSPPLDMVSVGVTITNNVDSQQTFFPPSNSASSGNTLTFPATFALVIPPSRSGAVTVDIEGTDDQGQIITHGTVTSTIHVGERTNLYVTLDPGGFTCGDGTLDPGEGCDDGNQLSGDGCDAACRIEAGGSKPGADAGTGGRLDARPSGDGGVQDVVTVVTEAGGNQPVTPLSGSAFISVAAGNGFSCAARYDGSLYCWGDNSAKQLGVTVAKSLLLAPAQLAGGRWLATTAGQYHACAIDSSKVITCWGQADSGQLGKAATNGQIVQVADSDWAMVSAGAYHTCATKLDNSLWCWGYNSSGQLGLGLSGPQESDTPAKVSDEQKWAVISVGSGHSCATKSDGTLWCWGSNSNGQIGIGTIITTFSPAQVAGTGFTAVSAGASHTCATHSDGSLACWGLNDIGQLGDGTTAQRSVPAPVPGTDWLVVGAGSAHTCAIKSDGSLWCWGDNTTGQLGDGTNTNHIQPTRIASSAGPWAAISLGNGHTCATLSTGSLYCWGDNSKGQLGDGTTTQRNRPILIGAQ
jgi:cysteine-rich repeat protein